MQQFLGFAFHPTHVEKATREEITRTRQEEDSWGVIRKPHKLFPTGFERDPKIKEQPSKEEREWEVVDQAEFERGELEETTERDARAVQRKNESPAMSEDENFEYADDESPRALSEAEEEEEQEEEYDVALPPSRLFPQDLEKMIAAHAHKHIKKEKQAKRTTKRDKKRTPPTLAEIGAPCRITKKLYVAMEEKGAYGLVDSGETRLGTREIVMHITRGRKKLYEVEPRAGDVMRVKSLIDSRIHQALDVVFTTPHKYYPPGRDATTCVVGVPEAQWQKLKA